MPKTLNAITHDDYLRAEGARMMLAALQDFIRKWRASDGNRKPSPDKISVEGEEYPFCYVAGISTDMMVDGVRRLTASTFNCVDFIYGRFPEYASFKGHDVKTKKGYKIDNIDFHYRKEKQ